MRIHEGVPVQPDAAGCCVGLGGGTSWGYQPCASEVSTAGAIIFPDSDVLHIAYSCDRHAEVLAAPRPLTAADIAELDRRAGRVPLVPAPTPELPDVQPA